MTNIPRRKIYECMLEYEEAVLEIQILARDEKSFEKFKEQYSESIKVAKQKYFEIKALLLMFFENNTFESEEAFTDMLTYYIINKKEVEIELKNNKNLTKQTRQLLRDMDEVFEKVDVIKTFREAKEIFKMLDQFNSTIPIILEIRRDEMK